MASLSTQAEKYVYQLHKTVLSWDFFQLEQQKDPRLRKVPVTFKDSNDYTSTFEPLLLEECRAQILRSQQEGGSKPFVTRVRYLGEINDFYVAGFSVQQYEEHDFHENDLILLCVERPPYKRAPVSEDAEADAAQKKKDEEDGKPAPEPEPENQGELNKELHLVGSVENIEPGGLRVRFYLGSQGARFKRMHKFLHYERDWWLVKLCNLSTLQREYASLYLAPSYPLLSSLLDPSRVVVADAASGALSEPAKAPHVIMTIPPPLLVRFEEQYNPSQLEAIKAAVSDDGITLIQGPPGTGKTHVILGLISVLLHSQAVRVASADEVAKREQLRIPSKIREEDKLKFWNSAQPWLRPVFENPRDNLTAVDPSYEAQEMERRKRVRANPLDVPEKARARKNRILLCAPSNGAVDEIVARLLDSGLFNAEGKPYQPTIVRVGPGSHKDIESVTLEHLVRTRQQSLSSNVVMPSTSASSAAATTVKGVAGKNLDLTAVRNEILDSASIIATTLSFSGSGVLSKVSTGFSAVIIDEAAQAVETSILIPLRYNSRHLVLVGDPNQLPATIISQEAVKYGYDQSLFKRLQASAYTMRMLRVQYRMHPLLRAFPSAHFYEDQLEDAPHLASTRVMPYHAHKAFGPFTLYDVSFSKEQKSSTGSTFNEEEAQVVLFLYQALRRTYAEIDFTSKVGIISPYKEQVMLLRQLFQPYPDVNIDTVDGFQGREREIIILSCVRAPLKGGSVGFLADIRRMNVAITRPRCSLLVVANASALKRNSDWNAFIRHAKQTRAYVCVTSPSEEFLTKVLENEFFEECADDGFINLQKELDKEHAEGKSNGKQKKQKKTAKQELEHSDSAQADAGADVMEVDDVDDVLKQTPQHNEKEGDEGSQSEHDGEQDATPAARKVLGKKRKNLANGAPSEVGGA